VISRGKTAVMDGSQWQPTLKPDTCCMQCTALLVHCCLT